MTENTPTPKTDEIVYCLRCGRKLTNPKYKDLGMGQKCYEKFLGESQHKKLFTIGKKK